MRLIDADALKKSITDWYCDPERCNNYYGVKCRACQLDDALSAIDDAPTVSQWVSVKDQLPGELKDLSLRKTQKPVLLYAEKDGAIYVGWYCGRDFRGIDCFISRTSMNAYQHITKKITYWMPLPAPPKEGDIECD